MYIASIMVLSNVKIGILGDSSKRKVFGTLIVAMLLAISLYSGIQDPARLPWNGGLRLSPVTVHDRLEMIPIAKYAVNDTFVVAWHDVYIPLEYNPYLHLRSFGSYPPAHETLLKIAIGTDVQTPNPAYFVLPKIICSGKAFSRFNLVYNSLEHIVLMTK